MAEAAFKPVPGGHIFQAPNGRPFGPPRFYQVNDSEKAELIALKRASAERWRPVLNFLSSAGAALIVASVACFAFLAVIAGVACAVGAVALVVISMATVRLSQARTIAPVLARLTPSTVAITRREAFERTTEAMRRGLASEGIAAGTPLGGWFESWNASGTTGFVQTMVKTQMRIDVQIESFLARGIYWIGLLAALGIVGFWIGVVVQDGYARHDLMLVPAALAIAVVVYFLGWAWRWLWTGRTDQLFAAARHTPAGQLDDMRKNVTSLLALR
jgi:hypothetical protein